MGAGGGAAGGAGADGGAPAVPPADRGGSGGEQRVTREGAGDGGVDYGWSSRAVDFLQLLWVTVLT